MANGGLLVASPCARSVPGCPFASPGPLAWTLWLVSFPHFRHGKDMSLGTRVRAGFILYAHSVFHTLFHSSSMASTVASQELHGDTPTPVVPEEVCFESPSPGSRTLSHNGVVIGHPVHSRHCTNRQQCTVEETQPKESLSSWGTHCEKCHCRDQA